MACPYAAAENDQSRYSRRLGIIRMLDWLEAQPGATWQDRWRAGCRAAADQDWRDTAELHLKDTGRIAADNHSVWSSLGGALGLLIGCDVIRPDLGWLLASATPAYLAADVARVRDPEGFVGGLVHDQHRVRSVLACGKTADGPACGGVQHPLLVAASAGQQVLHPVRAGVPSRLGKRPAVAVLELGAAATARNPLPSPLSSSCRAWPIAFAASLQLVM